MKKSFFVSLALIISTLFSCAGHAWGSKKKYKSEIMDLKLTIFYVAQRYLEPERIDASKMFLAGLDNAARMVPEIMVREASGLVEVEVMGKTRRFKGKIESVLYLMESFSDAYKFLKANLPKDVKLEKVEHAMISGMLETLDPHTNYMPADYFKEMKIHHSGAFGGLGIVVAVCSGKLSVLKVLPNGPAFTAGLKPGDHIISINKTSTDNLSLQEAVKRLRGEPGDAVAIQIKRINKIEKYTISRQVISYDGVSHQTIKSEAGDLGYIKIRGFQVPTAAQVKSAIVKMKNKNIRGLIIDMRGNGGGLLRSAIEIVNFFLDTGTIVSQVAKNSNRSGRREYRADFSSTIYKGPLVVLVDEGSASASEIVAGSLKYSGRAVVLGARTFGKGSVQDVIEYPLDSALKITISQYLTYGDVSIQGRGIVPDIEVHDVKLNPKNRGRQVVFYTSGRETMTEASLKSSLKAARANISAKSSYYIYTLGAKAISMPFKCHYCGQDPDDDYSEDQDAFKMDGVVKTAKALLETRRGKHESREITLHKSKAALAEFQKKEMKKISDELKKTFKIDWTENKTSTNPSLSVSLKPVKNNVPAGSWAKLELKVKNTGKQPAFRIRSELHSSNPRINFQEVLFGKIDAGKEVKKIVEVKIPDGVSSRMDYVKADFFSDVQKLKFKSDSTITVKGANNPSISMSYYFKDTIGDDGKLEENETGEFHVILKNTGKGKCGESSLILKNFTGPQVEMINTKSDLSKLGAGQTREIVFRVKAIKTSADEYFQFKLKYKDCVFADELEIPWFVKTHRSRQDDIKKVNYWVRAANNLEVTDVPWEKARQKVWQAKKGSSFNVTAEKNNYLRISTGDKKFPYAWVARSSTALMQAKGKTGKLSNVFTLTPPEIKINNYQMMVSDGKVTLTGKITDTEGLRDFYVSVSNIKARIYGKKVEYKVLGNILDYNFKVVVPLYKGINIISIVARDKALTKQSENAIVLFRK
ncbi:PDZ domain-containing protein [Myxococcota bacterium]|nr:PDZ domain-containing protein [Myxococcota bacterium]MBU1379349.1 PDZ domain-containing protein [Myxococcota bacterium]MBU1497047.1 PDZ domain-containing protein [Myxococcota bacterium]